MGRIFDEIVLIYDEWDWKRRNRHNYTTIGNSFNRNCVKVGNYTYGKLNVITANGTTRLYIGSYCAIGPNVTFIVSGSHPMDRISTYPFKTCILKAKSENIYDKDMHIEDDVWIGANVTILPGIYVGQGAVIGAGSVVTKDVEPYEIVAGNPAKHVRYRFSDEMRDKLLELDYSKLDFDIINQNIEKLYCSVNENDKLDWFPRKNKV